MQKTFSKTNLLTPKRLIIITTACIIAGCEPIDKTDFPDDDSGPGLLTGEKGYWEITS